MPPIPAWRSSSYRGGGGNADNISGRQADNVWFGSYYQQKDNTKDPVKWRVLSNASGQLFLLADQNLDVFQYHTERENVTWETSTMRSWLNGYDASANTGGRNGIDYTNDNFLDAAFSAKEQAAIAVTNVVNYDNDDYGTDGGNDTSDRIFLLSLKDISLKYSQTYTWPSTNTAYVAAGGKLGKKMNDAGTDDCGGCVPPASIIGRRHLSNGRALPPTPTASGWTTIAWPSAPPST